MNKTGIMAELTRIEVNHAEMTEALRGELIAAAREAQASAYRLF